MSPDESPDRGHLAALLEVPSHDGATLLRAARRLPPSRRLSAGAISRGDLVALIEQLAEAGALAAAVKCWILLGRLGWADQPTSLAAAKRLGEVYGARPRASLRRALRLLAAQAADNGGVNYRFSEAFEATGDWSNALAKLERAGELGVNNVNTLEKVDRLRSRLRQTPPDRRILVVGNCQALSLAACLRQLCPTAEVDGELWAIHQAPAAADEFLRSLGRYDLVITQTFKSPGGFSSDLLRQHCDQLFECPRIFFSGFHPDLVRMLGKDTPPEAQFRAWHSGIILAGYRLGLPRERVAKLFNAYIYGRLGYFDEYERALAMQVQEGARLGIPLAEMARDWSRQGPFVHMPDHPTIGALNSLAKHFCNLAGLAIDPDARLPRDIQGEQLVWPVYPEIAKRLGLQGSLNFKPHRPLGVTLTLTEVIDSYYSLYEGSAAPEHAKVAEIEAVLKAEGL